MCGICGFTDPMLGENSPLDQAAALSEAAIPCGQAAFNRQAVLQEMCDVMAHRGPDGQGAFLGQGIALGHRRLALIDLQNGCQPMIRRDSSFESALIPPAASALEASQDYDARFALVFNGEIYNYQDLTRELRAAGYQLKTGSDTEVLLTGYIAWGRDVLLRLRGMFAFALWDSQTQTLFCARDPFGIKPFYYTCQQDRFIFASEIKSILKHPAYQRELNEEALEQYLCFEFSALPETFFKGIFKLEPGCCLTVDLQGNISTNRYWQPSFRYRSDWSPEKATDAIDSTMRESVRYHNVADVEVGSFLSSGIDSSYLAACLAKENPSIRTFTVGFAEYEGERDEISWARELAERLHVRNNSKHITQQEYWDAVEKVLWHMDEPIADPSAIALYFVDQLAATQVKAVLSGEGADELFAGYRIYQVPLENKRISWLPRPVLRAGASLAKALHLRGANYLERASERPEDWYYTNANGVAFTPDERRRLLKGKHARSPQDVVSSAYAQAGSNDDITRMQQVDICHWLANDILLKTDKMAMAHSLESRVPFLDREVFNLAASIPPELKVSRSQTKTCLRSAAVRAIPKDWAEKEKLGFPVPLAAWLREDDRCQQIRACFASEPAQKFFDTDYLSELVDQHMHGADNSRKIWIAYAFLVWYDLFFEQESAIK